MQTTTTKPQAKRQEAVNALVTECQVFFAFSNKQFDEGKAAINLPAGEKLVDIGAGGFMPAKHKARYIAGMEQIHEDFSAAMQDQVVRGEREYAIDTGMANAIEVAECTTPDDKDKEQAADNRAEYLELTA